MAEFVRRRSMKPRICMYTFILYGEMDDCRGSNKKEFRTGEGNENLNHSLYVSRRKRFFEYMKRIRII